jgi:hypothetical protein
VSNVMKEGTIRRRRVGAAGVRRRFEDVLREQVLWLKLQVGGLALHAQPGEQVSGLRVSS